MRSEDKKGDDDVAVGAILGMQRPYNQVQWPVLSKFSSFSYYAVALRTVEVIPIAQIKVDTESSVAFMSCNACSKVWDATGIKLRFGIGTNVGRYANAKTQPERTLPYI